MKVILRKHLDAEGIQILDREIWSIIWTKKHDLIAHFITDSREYLVYAYQKYRDSICYGLHWQKLQDTQNQLRRRATSLADALDVYACFDVRIRFQYWYVEEVHYFRAKSNNSGRRVRMRFRELVSFHRRGGATKCSVWHASM